LSLQSVDERNPQETGVLFQTADGTNKKIAFTPAKAGSRVDAISVLAVAAADKTMAVDLHTGAAYTTLSQIIVPANSGLGAIRALDLLSLLPVPLQQGFALPYGTDLYLSMAVALTGTDSVQVVVLGGDF